MGQRRLTLGRLLDMQFHELVVRLHITLCAGLQQQVVVVSGAPNIIGRVFLGEIAGRASDLKVARLKLSCRHFDGLPHRHRLSRNWSQKRRARGAAMIGRGQEHVLAVSEHRDLDLVGKAA